MKLAGQKELIVAGILIFYIAFVPSPSVVKGFLGSAIGKALALALVVYVWKYVSAVVSLLLLVVVVRDSNAVFEHLDVAPTQCKCKNPDFTPDKANTGCFNKAGKEDKSSDAMTCQCPNGYSWDIIGKQCKANQLNQSKPVEPTAVGTSPAAPAVSMGPTTSPNMPETTGSAAAQKMQTASPSSSESTGVQPASGTSSTTASV
jgi:hypothetical protein